MLPCVSSVLTCFFLTMAQISRNTQQKIICGNKIPILTSSTFVWPCVCNCVYSTQRTAFTGTPQDLQPMGWQVYVFRKLQECPLSSWGRPVFSMCWASKVAQCFVSIMWVQKVAKCSQRPGVLSVFIFVLCVLRAVHVHCFLIIAA